MAEVRQNSDRREQVRRAFEDAHGEAPAVLAFGPGRVNLIGEHIDYHGGDVLPIALARGVWAAGRRRGDGALSLASLDRPGEDVRCDAVAAVAAGAGELGWAAYPVGVWQQVAAATGRHDGVDLVFGGDLPFGSGVSSSAALEIATARALDALFETGLDDVTLARLAHRAENDFVGLPCGIMDQWASAVAKPGHALLLHCRDQSYEHVPLAGIEPVLLLLDTGTPRTLVSSGYRQRVEEGRRVLALLRERVGARPFLVDYELEELAAVAAAAGDVLLRRARHVITEHRRVRRAVAALREGALAELGTLMNASHASGRDDYEVSTVELDEITEAARQSGALGARFCGAGFGGCAIALVSPAGGAAVADGVRRRYRERFGVEPGIEVLRPRGGKR